MARNEENSERYAAQINPRCFFNQKIRLHRFRFQKEPSIFEEIWISDERNAVFVISHLALARLLDFGCIVKMVEMTVSDYQQIQSYPLISYPFR
jgi:hypothetical protein